MGDTKVIAFANNKGGSGKTTSCANVGYCLWSLGKKVLLIDGDMQMNLSLSFFDEIHSILSSFLYNYKRKVDFRETENIY